jgi:thioredoxin 1
MLIWMSVFSTSNVHWMMDELEEIRARKITKMMSRTVGHHAVGPVRLTDADFRATIESNHLVVVDCWAAWCYPCRILEPTVEELANKYRSMALFAKLNVDENPMTAASYDIQSIPTILIIKDGAEADRIVGAVPKAEIEAALTRHL